MPRLGYQKVRTGCVKCRERRVKCDEERPCSACFRHGVQCSLMESAPSPQGQRPRRAPKPLHRIEYPSARKRSLVPLKPSTIEPLNSESSQSASNDDPYPYLVKLVRTPGSESSESWISDLELIHHFTAITWKTLPRGADLSEIWQIELPSMAFKHGSLAHQVLSLSANHMAFLNPEQHSIFSIRASQHQNQAVQGLREALSRISNLSCHAVFGHASLLAINAFAIFSGQASQEHYPGIDDLLHVFLLIRGINGILKSYEDIIIDGPLGKLLRMGNFQSETPLLLEIVRELESIILSSQAESPMAVCCRESISSFIDWITHARNTASLPELRVIMSWPTRLSDEFVHLLRERYKPALQVLACYCRVLESMGVTYWYLRGWGEHVKEDIGKFLS